MENGNAPSNAPDLAASLATGRLTEQERQTLHERVAAAHAAAADAVARFAALLEQSRNQLATTAGTLVAIEETREVVRQSVERYVVSMKALGTPPETTLRLVKETVAGQMPLPERDDASRKLSASVVTWCIEAYYGGSSAA